MLPCLRPLIRLRRYQALPSISRLPQLQPPRVSPVFSKFFSTSGDDGDNMDAWAKAWHGGDLPQDPTSGLNWGDVSSWSTGLTKDHFDGEAVGRPVTEDPQSRSESQSQPQPPPPPPPSPREIARLMDDEDALLKRFKDAYKETNEDADVWEESIKETCKLMKQVRQPGVRGEYLKDSDKAEMYRLHKENPEVNTVEKLAKDFRVMRQRVHAILWLKEMEEEEEKKRGKPLDDSIEFLLDNFPE